jgi:hypothetical protein
MKMDDLQKQTAATDDDIERAFWRMVREFAGLRADQEIAGGQSAYHAAARAGHEDTAIRPLPATTGVPARADQAPGRSEKTYSDDEVERAFWKVVREFAGLRADQGIAAGQSAFHAAARAGHEDDPSPPLPTSNNATTPTTQRNARPGR